MYCPTQTHTSSRHIHVWEETPLRERGPVLWYPSDPASGYREDAHLEGGKENIYIFFHIVYILGGFVLHTSACRASLSVLLLHNSPSDGVPWGMLSCSCPVNPVPNKLMWLMWEVIIIWFIVSTICLEPGMYGMYPTNYNKLVSSLIHFQRFKTGGLLRMTFVNAVCLCLCA